jgi:hypothetical protein
MTGKIDPNLTPSKKKGLVVVVNVDIVLEHM